MNLNEYEVIVIFKKRFYLSLFFCLGEYSFDGKYEEHEKAYEHIQKLFFGKEEESRSNSLFEN
jgi:hypothetical protein